VRPPSVISAASVACDLERGGCFMSGTDRVVLLAVVRLILAFACEQALLARATLPGLSSCQAGGGARRRSTVAVGESG
jgi:hypothetical protein